MEFFSNLKQLFSTFQVTDAIDILLISVLIYSIIILVKETRAEQLIKGFIILIILSQVSDWLNLYTVHWLLSNLLTVGLILIIVIFQPELRRAFERLGRSRGWLLSFGSNDEKEEEGIAEELVRACTSLSRQHIGALIVLENKTGLNELLDTGTRINGLVSAELLINIFIPNTPLHDGAVIIRKDRVMAAGVFLPLTENKNLSRELGTRHRAAIGISERSDALVLVVSEETGLISVCQNGQIARRIDGDSLREILLDFYANEEEDTPIRRMSDLLGQSKKRGEEKKRGEKETGGQAAEKEEQESAGEENETGLGRFLISEENRAKADGSSTEEETGETSVEGTEDSHDTVIHFNVNGKEQILPKTAYKTVYPDYDESDKDEKRERRKFEKGGRR